jgi:hypothetical protein
MKITTHSEMPVSFRLPEPLARDVQAASSRLHLNRTAILRLAIQRGLPIVLQRLGDIPSPVMPTPLVDERRAS